MDEELIQALQAFKPRMEPMEARLLERMDATETRLLSAFHGWSVSMELRIKSLPVIDQRLGVMEDRLSAVERKLLAKGI